MQEGEHCEPIAIVSAVILQGNFETLGSKFSHETEGLLASPLPKEAIKKEKTFRRKKCLNLKILS